MHVKLGLYLRRWKWPLKYLNGKYLAVLMDQYRKLLSEESATVREPMVYTRI
jgi:hypothetical protein